MSAEPIPYFLERLALGLEAQARDIKRAYARELKLIDQEADLPGFQWLRECYEIGLRWAVYEAGRKEQDEGGTQPPPQPDVPPPPPQPVTPAVLRAEPDGFEALDVLLPPPARVSLAKTEDPLAAIAPQAPQAQLAAPAEDADQLSIAVFERFSSAYAMLSRGRTIDDIGLWETELRRRLADDELINLEARTIFEARVAHLLAGDWDAANAPLFSAAATVFEWAGDRRRLGQFGNAGAYMHQVAEEARMFEAQTPEELRAQRQILLKLRRKDAASSTATKLELACIERMIERFPSFLALQANYEVVEQWRLRGRKVRPSTVRAPVVDTTPEPVLYGDTSKKRGFDKAWLLFLLIAVLALARVWQVHGSRFSSPASDGGQFYPPQANGPVTVFNPPSLEPSNRRVDQGNRPVQQQAALDQALVDAIGNDIDYKYGKDAQLGERQVKFEVFLDADGKVLGVNKMSKSIDIAYDDAVKAAIMRAKPFPPSAGTRISLQFGMTLFRKEPRPVRGGKAATAQPAEATVEEAPAEEAPAAAGPDESPEAPAEELSEAPAASD